MNADRLLPHDIASEEALLGSIILDGDCFGDVAYLIAPGDFYRERHGLIFAACGELFRRGEGIDQVTVARELGRTENLEPSGGMAYLSHLVAQTPTSTHVVHYGQQVYTSATMRRLIDAAGRIAVLGYDDTADVDETLRSADDILAGVRTRQAEQGFVPVREILDQLLLAPLPTDEKDQDLAPVMSGFAKLDEMLEGLRKSNMLILGARPGVGKSAMVSNIAGHVAKAGGSVGIFSLEMSREELVLRMVVDESQIDSHRLKMGLYTNDEEERFMAAVGSISERNIFIDDTFDQNVARMRGKARRLSNGVNGLDLLVVDYLQLIQGQRSGRGGDNRVMEISEISRGLKGIAKDLRIPVITCSQLSRNVENRPNHKPMLSDLRDSGSIEQDADVVMFLYREDLYYTEEEWGQHHPEQAYPRNIAECIVAKNRHGPTGSFKMRFRNNLVRFEEMEEK